MNPYSSLVRRKPQKKSAPKGRPGRRVGGSRDENYSSNHRGGGRFAGRQVHFDRKRTMDAPRDRSVAGGGTGWSRGRVRGALRGAKFGPNARPRDALRGH